MSINIAPKTASAGVAGAFTILIVWVIGLFHIQVPPEIASALTTVVAFMASYLAPRTPPPSPELK